MPRFNTPEKAYAEAERVIEEARRAGDVALSLTSLGLEELPESLGQLTQLQFLFVSYNQLSALPEWIRQLTQLRILNVSGNRLKTLPTSLQQLEESGTLRELYLHNNYDLNIPLEILGCKWHERSEKQPADPREILRYYFSQQRAGNAHPLNEAKVLFIGESEVGKSSLIAALAHGKFKQSFDKTRGIVREKWMVPEADNLRLNLWDFGGQEVYHSTHTFFLTERALYVVVVNARDNDRQNNIEYWLQMARSFGGDAPILVAINKCDQHGAGPDENLLRRKYGGNLEFIRTSCHSGEGLPSLKKAILARIAGLPEVRREIPDAWLRLKDELEAMTQDTLPVSAYRALCVRCGESDEANQNLLLDLWHKLGTVLYFHHDDEDEEDMSALGILNPDWVTRGVYAVLDDKELMNRQGLLTKKQLAETLRRAKYQGDDPDFIEAMMRKFDLLYDAPDMHPRKMFVPRLLSEKEPDFNWPESGTLRFVYRYEVLPSGLLPRFIARSHRHLSNAPCPWRHGCVLELSDCRALVRADEEAKTVEISVCGAESQRREALDRVRLTFDDIHGQIKDLPYEEFIPVPGHPDAPLLKYSHLRKLEWNDKLQYDAEGARPGEIIEVDVSEALGNVRTAARKQRDEAQSQIYVAGDYLAKGDKMQEKRTMTIGGDNNAPANQGNDAAVGENIIKGDNNDQRILQLSPEQENVLQNLQELRHLIEQARTEGANKYVCDAAEGNVAQLEEATKEPDSAESKEKAKGALALLEGAAKGFESYEKIGKSFENILKIVGPALGAIIGAQF